MLLKGLSLFSLARLWSCLLTVQRNNHYFSQTQKTDAHHQIIFSNFTPQYAVFSSLWDHIISMVVQFWPATIEHNLRTTHIVCPRCSWTCNFVMIHINWCSLRTCQGMISVNEWIVAICNNSKAVDTSKSSFAHVRTTRMLPKAKFTLMTRPVAWWRYVRRYCILDAWDVRVFVGFEHKANQRAEPRRRPLSPWPPRPRAPTTLRRSVSAAPP